MVEDGFTLLLLGAVGWPVIPVKSTMLRHNEAQDDACGLASPVGLNPARVVLCFVVA